MWAPNPLKVLPEQKSILCPNFAFAQTCIIAEPLAMAGYSTFPVTHMGWWLEAQSQLGEGCTFSISISTLAPSPGSFISQPSAESRGPGYGHSIFYHSASLQIKWMHDSSLQTPGKWEWVYELQRKRLSLGFLPCFPLRFLRVKHQDPFWFCVSHSRRWTGKQWRKYLMEEQKVPRKGQLSPPSPVDFSLFISPLEFSFSTTSVEMKGTLENT